MSDLRYDDEPLPVYDRYGPFSTYVLRSVGVGYTGHGCRCDPTRGQSCKQCTGKPSAAIRQELPPCMRPDWDPVAARAREMARYRAVAARMGLTGDYAQEAS